jgi:hypothetical protein
MVYLKEDYKTKTKKKSKKKNHKALDNSLEVLEKDTPLELRICR